MGVGGADAEDVGQQVPLVAALGVLKFVAYRAVVGGYKAEWAVADWDLEDVSLESG